MLSRAHLREVARRPAALSLEHRARARLDGDHLLARQSRRVTLFSFEVLCAKDIFFQDSREESLFRIVAESHSFHVRGFLVTESHFLRKYVATKVTL